MTDPKQDVCRVMAEDIWDAEADTMIDPRTGDPLRGRLTEGWEEREKFVKELASAIRNHTIVPEMVKALSIAREYFCHHRTPKEEKIYKILYDVAIKAKGGNDD